MIHIVIGTRAQIIKMGPVMLALKRSGVDYNLIYTLQHTKTMFSMLNMFGLKKPDYLLVNRTSDVVSVPQLLSWLPKSLALGIYNKKRIFRDDKNGLILAHGDTPSTLLAAILGKAAHLKVAHIESGLRSFNLFQPFPEEIIRLFTFRLADYYFCPGAWALSNVKKFRGEKIDIRVNTLYDALREGVKKAEPIDVPKEKFVLFNIHRFETISRKAKLEEVIGIAKSIAKKFKVIFVLHPPTQKKLENYGFFQDLRNYPGIEIKERLEYFSFIKRFLNCEFMVTDGGSNQEESFYLGKPCLLLRQATERQEGLGKNVVLSKFKKEIIEGFIREYKRFERPPLNYDFSPSQIIVERIKEFA